MYKVLLLLLLLYLSFCFGRLHYLNFISMEQKSRAIVAENQQKLERIRQLERKKVELNNLEYLKEFARKNLYLMDPREVHIKIIPNPADGSGKEK